MDVTWHKQMTHYGNWQRSESLQLNIVHSNASISHSRTYHDGCAVTKMRCDGQGRSMPFLVLVWSLPRFVACLDFVACELTENTILSLVEQNACHLPTVTSRQPFHRWM